MLCALLCFLFRIQAGPLLLLLQVIKAHGPGLKMPSLHDGQPVLQGVRALALANNNTELISGGSDGQLLVWDTSGGQPGRVMQAVQVGDSSH